MFRSYASYVLEAEQRSLAKTGQLPYIGGFEVRGSRVAAKKIPERITIQSGPKPKQRPFMRQLDSSTLEQRAKKELERKAAQSEASRRNRDRAIAELGGVCLMCKTNDSLVIQSPSTSNISNYLKCWNAVTEQKLDGAFLACRGCIRSKDRPRHLLANRPKRS